MADVAPSPTPATTAPDQAAQPPLDQSDAVASLLSLSFAESGVAPAKFPGVKMEPPAQQSLSAALLGHVPSASVPATSNMSSGGKHHRRLSSTGKTRRRLSDAREAANRPSPSLIQPSSAALSLATLSLSSSPPSSYPVQSSTSLTGAGRTLAPAPPKGASAGGANPHDNAGIQVAGDDEKNGAIPIPISSANGRTGKKRGMDHRCESCSKIYRHPSCLIKHRWEHTPHWREASKFVLSKHQQVQLLEAAAILSHMSPAASGGRSLPEDRSLWPSFLSGGSLPPPEPPIPTNRMSNGHETNISAPAAHNPATTVPYTAHPVSSSVPVRSTSTGPRLHDYGVGPGVVTQVRPGLIGVTTSSGGGVAVIGERTTEATASATQPVPVPVGGAGTRHYHDAFGSVSSTGSASYYRHGTGESWGSHGYGSAGQYGAHPYGTSVPGSLPNGANAAGGWSLPKSSVRSESGYSRSRSRSRTRRAASGSSESPPSDDESVDVDSMMEARDRALDRDVNIVIEEEEDEEEERIQVDYDKTDDGKTGMRTPRTGCPYGGGRYPQAYGRSANQPLGHGRTLRSGRRGVGHGDRSGRNYDLREEDEEMDVNDAARGKPGLSSKKEQEWDGMEMEMDMDMD